jgi:elongation factor P
MMFRTALLALFSASAMAFAPTSIPKLNTLSSTALNVSINTADIKNGLTVEIDGEPYKVLNFSIMKQARGAAKTTIKFKNLMRGNTLENTYRSGEKFETAQIDRSPAQYTYSDENGNYYFMDSESFEEIMVESKVIEDSKKWIIEGMECKLVYFKGNVIEVQTPSPFTYEIIETEPTVKGNTVNAHTKPAVVGAGATITVPGFIAQGELIKVDTEKGEYVERG